MFEVHGLWPVVYLGIAGAIFALFLVCLVQLWYRYFRQRGVGSETPVQYTELPQRHGHARFDLSDARCDEGHFIDEVGEDEEYGEDIFDALYGDEEEEEFRGGAKRRPDDGRRLFGGRRDQGIFSSFPTPRPPRRNAATTVPTRGDVDCADVSETKSVAKYTEKSRPEPARDHGGLSQGGGKEKRGEEEHDTSGRISERNGVEGEKGDLEAALVEQEGSV